ncbi:hypothetical protein [Hydrogenophaga sp. RWCD_12]|uniref:hypothetical protein n=1 Tax=Hydrogenophaga sp. RWCD_12 TaxID=3391190 RepID=UPI0039847AE6
MNSPVPPVTLRLSVGPRQTLAEWGADGRRSLPVGTAVLWPATTSGPSALAIENAIQLVEDQIEGLVPRVPRGGRLVVSADTLAPLQRGGAIAGLEQGTIALAQIEREYQSLAGRAIGAPSARGSGFDDPAGDAVVLILREVMHHLGFDVLHAAA